MKAFIVLALVFAVNSSFLRDLDGTSIAVIDVEIAPNCSVAEEVTITATTGDSNLSGKFNITLTSGKEADDITLTLGTVAAPEVEWTIIPSTEKTGIYKVKSIVGTAADNSALTVTVGDNVTSTLMISVAAVHNATQEETQEIEEGKAFTILFNDTLTKVPFIYAASDATAPIADCSIDTADAKKVSCKPTGEEMKGKEEFTIHYKNGCEAALVATKVKVKFTAEGSSAFMTLGKVALFALALLF